MWLKRILGYQIVMFGLNIRKGFVVVLGVRLGLGLIFEGKPFFSILF